MNIPADLSPSNITDISALTVVDKEIIRRACMRSFYNFIRYTWSTVDPSAFIDAWHIQVMSHYLELFSSHNISNLLINIPPGHGKSLVASVMFPAWQWLKNPAESYLCFSHSEDLTSRDAGRCRDLIRSDIYKQVMQPQWQMKKDQDEKTYYKNTKHGTRYAFGCRSRTTGNRGSMKIIDDPLDAAEADSYTARLYINEYWFDQKMITRLIDPTRGDLIIAQRLHEDDLIGHVLKKYPGRYEQLCLQAEYDPSALPANCNRYFKDPRQKGEILFSSLYDASKLRLLKTALGSFGTASQLQQSPRARDGNFFKRSWFKRYRSGEVLVEDLVEIIDSWDCAIKDKPQNDRAAGQVWGKIRPNHPLYPNRYILLDFIAARADIVDNLKMIDAMHAKHPYIIERLIEDKANGSPIITMMNKRGGGTMRITPFNPGTRSKEMRASAVAPIVESGLVLIPHDDDRSDIAEWLEEITGFNKAKHDDQVDAFTQALLHFTQGTEWFYAC